MEFKKVQPDNYKEKTDKKYLDESEIDFEDDSELKKLGRQTVD